MSGYSDQEKQEAVDLYSGGKSAKEAGIRCGASIATVLKWVREAGGTIRRPGRPERYTKNRHPILMRDKFLALHEYLNGDSYEVAALRHGMTRQRLHQLAAEVGVAGEGGPAASVTRIREIAERSGLVVMICRDGNEL